MGLLALLGATAGTLVLLVVALIIYYPGPASAQVSTEAAPGTTIKVNTEADEANTDGYCSLREAILAANTNAKVDKCAAGSSTERDAIHFALGDKATITLASDLPTITDPAGLTIDGGSADITVDGFIEEPEPPGPPKILLVFEAGSGAKITLNEITVDHGLISNNSGTLTLTHSTFITVGVNEEGSGAKISFDKVRMRQGSAAFNDGGMLTVTNSSFSGAKVFQEGSGAKLTVDKLSMRHGGININSGTLTVTNSSFSGSRGRDNGGGINNVGGTLTVTNSTFSDNKARNNGGGIYNSGTATVRNSTFSDNEADPFKLTPCFTCGGGGIHNHGTATVRNSTFSDNEASQGGGIFNDGTLTVINSTFSDNSAGLGGGIDNTGGLDHGALLTVINSTFSGGSAEFGGGISNNDGGGLQMPGTTTLQNTIMANSSSGGDCDGTIGDGGYNLSSDASCGFSAANNSISGVPPMLGDLVDNGGPTKTIALLMGSPAINAIPQSTNDCGTEVTSDQRGVKRPQGNKCDIGAFEKKMRR